MLRRDFFDALFEENVPVRHWQRFVINEIHLVLAAAPLAFAGFDRHAGLGHPVAHRAQRELVACRLHSVIIDPVIARRRELAILRRKRVVKALVEEEEFQFARDTTGQFLFRQRIDLPSQNRPRRFNHKPSIVMQIITKHQRRAGLPGHETNGRKIGPHFEVAKTFLPVGQLEAVLRVHLDVHGEQIIARVRAMFHHVVEEKFPGEPFADEPPEHVRKRHDDGVDSSVVNFGPESLEVHNVA